MPHIHTDANQHDLTVTAFIVRTDTPEPRALLHMHKKLNVLLPVGGHVELSETPWQAIAHELTEESGYNLRQLEILQPKSRVRHITGTAQHPYPVSMNTHDITVDHFHTDIEYALVASSDPESGISDGESTDLQWLTKEQLAALPNTAIFDGTREIYQFIFDEALKTWDRVPANSFLLTHPKT